MSGDLKKWALLHHVCAGLAEPSPHRRRHSCTARPELRRWDKDLTIIPRVQSVRKWLGDACVIIDATLPEDVPDFPEKNKIPEEVLNHIRKRLESLR